MCEVGVVCILMCFCLPVQTNVCNYCLFMLHYSIVQVAECQNAVLIIPILIVQDFIVSCCELILDVLQSGESVKIFQKHAKRLQKDTLQKHGKVAIYFLTSTFLPGFNPLIINYIDNIHLF